MIALFVAFTQAFPDGANGTALPQSPPWKPGDIALTDDVSQLATAFPRFKTGNASGRLSTLGYFSFRYFWDLDMTGGDAGGLGGDFNRDGAVYGGVPLLLHDRDTLRSVVLSPTENFKAALTAQTKQPPLGDDLACGIHGRVRSLPPGFSHTTILFSDADQRRGVRRALLGWGDVLLARNNKPRKSPAPSAQQTRLGYGTATGAYYWYRTEAGANYEETMRAMERGQLKIRVRSLENEQALTRLQLSTDVGNKLLMSTLLLNLAVGRVGAVPAALWYAGAGFFGLQAGTTALSIKAFDKKRAKYESKDFGQKD